jgi:hypothetical protein
MRITWLRCHVPIRNGAGGINSAFIAPDYDVELTDRVFTIRKAGKLITQTGIENVVEFTAEEQPVEQESTAKKPRAKSAQ